MKIEIDFESKVIILKESVNLEKLRRFLKRTFKDYDQWEVESVMDCNCNCCRCWGCPCVTPYITTSNEVSYGTTCTNTTA